MGLQRTKLEQPKFEIDQDKSLHNHPGLNAIQALDDIVSPLPATLKFEEVLCQPRIPPSACMVGGLKPRGKAVEGYSIDLGTTGPPTGKTISEENLLNRPESKQAYRLFSNHQSGGQWGSRIPMIPCTIPVSYPYRGKTMIISNLET